MAEQARNLLMQAMGWIANPYLIPLAGCALALLVVGVFALLLFCLKRQIRHIRRELEAERERTERLQDIPQRLGEVQTRIEELNERTVPPGGWAPAPESVHLNRRGQVLKLHRGGHSVCEIASGLGVSQGEVRLTLKLHGLMRAQTAGKPDESPLIPEKIHDRNTRGLLVKEAG
jgi:hypothetical protein